MHRLHDEKKKQKKTGGNTEMIPIKHYDYRPMQFNTIYWKL